MPLSDLYDISMTIKQKAYYGIDFSDAIEDKSPKTLRNKLKKLSFYLLTSDLPVSEAQKAISAIKKGSQDTLDELLDTHQAQHQQFKQLYRKVSDDNNVHRLKVQQDQIRRLQDWVGSFGPLSSNELKEYAKLFELDKREIDSLQHRINYWVYHTPTKIKSYLDDYVVGQDDAKKMICWAFYNHLLRTGKIPMAGKGLKGRELPKSNILLLGPSGSGKTYTISTLAQLFGLPMVKVDCASLVSSGYVGKTLSDVFNQLIRQSPGGVRDAEKGIIFFDEFDKIADSMGASRSVGGVELQTEFLSIIQKGIFTIGDRMNDKRTVRMDDILFIFGGAFSGIDRIISNRMEKKPIGFNGKMDRSETDKEATIEAVNHEDLIKFGLLPELVNRISYVAVFNTLTKDDILHIMKESKASVLDQFKAYFKAHNKRLVIKEEVFETIAERVAESNKGARMINTMLLEMFRDSIFDLPDRRDKTFTFTKADLQ